VNKLDFGFGNAYCVRESLLDQVDLYVVGRDSLKNCNYTPYQGLENLVGVTKKVIYSQTNRQYNYIVLTIGASGAISVVLKEAKMSGTVHGITRKAPWYSKYPQMIKNHGLNHTTDTNLLDKNVILLDYPSNPAGQFENIITYNSTSTSTILDCVYLNKVYCTPIVRPVPNHICMIGSYGKLLGLNGVRVGWIATNSEDLYLKYKKIAETEYCGISRVDQDLIHSIATTIDWAKFENTARNKIDCNRYEISKLEKFFDYSNSVPENGMFFYSRGSKKTLELLDRANITYTKGSSMGLSDMWVRLNLAQTCEITKEAVDRIIKIDTIK
jgi:aspartate/methionine/tyrosine aminotransferase